MSTALPVPAPATPRTQPSHAAVGRRLPPVLVQLWALDAERLPLARRHLAYLSGDNGWEVTAVVEKVGGELPDRPAEAFGSWYRYGGSGWTVVAWRLA